MLCCVGVKGEALTPRDKGAAATNGKLFGVAIELPPKLILAGENTVGVPVLWLMASFVSGLTIEMAFEAALRSTGCGCGGGAG